MSRDARPPEFALIADFFAPLAADRPEACGLLDDAAWLRLEPGRDLVLTTDALVAGVHFLPDDSPDLIARKLLGVNLSDLAAKGARPIGYLLTLALPNAHPDWLTRFAQGLRQSQETYGIALFGGDTVAIPGPLTVSAAAFGWVEAGRMIRRSGALAGDGVYVSGTLGDAALGLQVLKGEIETEEPGDRSYLADRYRIPQPRSDLGPRLIGLATACADISDGLLADLGHICEVSGVGACVQADRIPLSKPARNLPNRDSSVLRAALAGGDDYELVFTAPPANEAELARLSAELGFPLTCIGRIVPAEEGVTVADSNGRALEVESRGYVHFGMSTPENGAATQG